MREMPHILRNDTVGVPTQCKIQDMFVARIGKIRSLEPA